MPRPGGRSGPCPCASPDGSGKCGPESSRDMRNAGHVREMSRFAPFPMERRGVGAGMGRTISLRNRGSRPPFGRGRGRRMRPDPFRENRTGMNRLGHGCRGRRGKKMMRCGDEFRRLRLRMGSHRLVGRFFLRVGLFGFGDLATEMAGFFAAEGILHSLEKSGLLRVRDKHAAPCIHLNDGVRPANHLQAGEQEKQKLDVLLQIACRVAEKRKDAGDRAKGSSGIKSFFG